MTNLPYFFYICFIFKDIKYFWFFSAVLLKTDNTYTDITYKHSKRPILCSCSLHFPICNALLRSLPSAHKYNLSQISRHFRWSPQKHKIKSLAVYLLALFANIHIDLKKTLCIAKVNCNQYNSHNAVH